MFVWHTEGGDGGFGLIGRTQWPESATSTGFRREEEGDRPPMICYQFSVLRDGCDRFANPRVLLGPVALCYAHCAGVCVCVCVCARSVRLTLTQLFHLGHVSLSVEAGGPRTTAWRGPTKTHPVCCANVPAEVICGPFGPLPEPLLLP